MPDKKPIEVGDEIEALCGTCKDATVHVVEVIKEGKITKVMCKSCLNSHKFRAPMSTAEKKAKKKTAAPKTSSKSKEQRKWSRVMAKADAENPQDYAMTATYEENDVIHHEKFGVGVVAEIVDPTKMNVVFEDGVKTMVQNRS
ncbi:hypothetical protein JXA02_14550 [candidate division KSB1 bacterium]|nr:hypothetical protein [candidate division KSB1 bacterium]